MSPVSPKFTLYSHHKQLTNPITLDISQYSDSFIVRSYEVDSSGKATLAHIGNYFQEAAGKHAHRLNFDISHLHEKGLTWVLFRMHIEVERFPERWEEVTVNTWPSSGDGIRAFRDYQLLDIKGEQIAAGISQWMVLNIETRRPARMPKEVLEMGLNVENHMIEPSREPFEEFGKADGDALIHVGADSLDMNNHANNVAYIRWMTGYLPSDYQNANRCISVELQYHAECGLNDRIVSEFRKLNQNTFLHRIVREEGRKLIAEGKSTWKATSSSQS